MLASTFPGPWRGRLPPQPPDTLFLPFPQGWVCACSRNEPPCSHRGKKWLLSSGREREEGAPRAGTAASTASPILYPLIETKEWFVVAEAPLGAPQQVPARSGRAAAASACLVCQRPAHFTQLKPWCPDAEEHGQPPGCCTAQNPQRPARRPRPRGQAGAGDQGLREPNGPGTREPQVRSCNVSRARIWHCYLSLRDLGLFWRIFGQPAGPPTFLL